MGDGFGGVLSPTILLVGPMSALDYGPLKLISVDFFSPHFYFNFWLEKKKFDTRTQKIKIKKIFMDLIFIAY